MAKSLIIMLFSSSYTHISNSVLSHKLLIGHFEGDAKYKNIKLPFTQDASKGSDNCVLAKR